MVSRAARQSWASVAGMDRRSRGADSSSGCRATTSRAANEPSGSNGARPVAADATFPWGHTSFVRYRGIVKVMVYSRGSDRPWLVDLATEQVESAPDLSHPVYDEARQMTYLHEPKYEAAIDSAASVGTKKADRETGEDQKGF